MQEAITNNELLGREPIEAIELLTAGMTRYLSVSLSPTYKYSRPRLSRTGRDF